MQAYYGAHIMQSAASLICIYVKVIHWNYSTLIRMQVAKRTNMRILGESLSHTSASDRSSNCAARITFIFCWNRICSFASLCVRSYIEFLLNLPWTSTRYLNFIIQQARHHIYLQRMERHPLHPIAICCRFVSLIVRFAKISTFFKMTYCHKNKSPLHSCETYK